VSYFQQLLFWLRRLKYPGSAAYWNRRYANNGDSGTGSGGELAAYKALFINEFIAQNNIQSVTELGCGDGRQLQLAKYPQYIGLDIASAAVDRCRELFVVDMNKTFAVYNPGKYDPAAFQADLTLSLEVIFHLTEQDLYERHLQHLFATSRRWVIIFAADEERTTPFPHFRLRHFTPDVARLTPGWVLRQQVKNPLSALSVSQFFVFEKR
jgi:SAM-dependent methyltransferase